MTAPGYSVVQYPHRNPGTRAALRLTLIVVPNTSPDQIVANVKANSALPLNWLKLQPVTDKPALIIGGGPSLKDNLEEIRALLKNGGVVYAVNGASAWLNGKHILPDWQVIADCKAESAGLVDRRAFGHLFSSAVDPDTMNSVPNPVVWHRNMEGIEALFPEERKSQEYALIGGTSGGTHAMCIAYALGHRDVHCFGFDSSHRDGHGHAYRQPMNDSIETCEVSWAGKTYQASIAMKAQAENFMTTARAMQKLGVTLTVHGDGLLPAMWNTPPSSLTEQDKYRLMWTFDQYRQVSPAEDLVPLIQRLLHPDGLVLDFGCGTARAAVELAKQGVEVFCIDFADNCRDHEALILPFLEWDLTQPLPIAAPYGMCCDVMEHIPTEDVPKVLANIMGAAEKVFFNISTIPDACGALIQQELHLTVRPHEWWIEALCQHGDILFAQANASDSLFVVSKTKELKHAHD